MNIDWFSPMSLAIIDAENISGKEINQFSVFYGTTNGQPHLHSFFEILYVEKGSLYHSVSAKEENVMKEGDFIFIDIGTIHDYTAIDDVSVINIVFTPDLFIPGMQDCSSIAELFKKYKLNLEPLLISFPVNTIMHDDNKTILNMIYFLREKAENPLSLTSTIIRHSLISLFMHITEPEYQDKPHLSSITEALLKLVDNHYAEPNLLTRATNELNYTASYISSIFKKDFGITFSDYLMQYRINIAKQLLRTTDMSITDISASVGYSDIKFFRDLFKKHTNMTPRQYKNSTVI